MSITEEYFKNLVEKEKISLQCKEYLNFLSKKVGTGATLKDTLKMLLLLVDEKGLEKAILELDVASYYVDEIMKNRKELEENFKLVIEKQKDKI